MISTSEYRDSILRRVRPLATTRVALADARGRVLAEPVTSRHSIPVFDNSAMDGYAVHRDDLLAAAAGTPVVLPVAADLPAGWADDAPLAPGTAARIMTGAPLPSGADAVVPVEHTDGGTDSVQIVECPRPSAHIRRAGEDVRVGDPVLPGGVRLTARQVSAAAAAGYHTLTVSRRPRVAVISTGSELVPPGLPLRRGEIPESNSVLLAGLARAAGAVVVEVVHVADNNERLAAVIDRCAERADLIILSGGVSVGAYDVVKAVLAPLPDMVFTKVAMQPGKPQGSGTLADGTLVCALPGNPVSACVSFEVFVRPALDAMQGAVATPGRIQRAVADSGWSTPDGREQYMPVTVTRDAAARLRVSPVSAGGSASHYVGSLSLAQGFARVDAHTAAVEAGDIVDVILVEL